jgi:hypothetical protein
MTLLFSAHAFLGYKDSNSIDTGSSALLYSIPVIPRLNFDTINGTNATATVTIPVCDGIVPGPCLDKTTAQIIP